MFLVDLLYLWCLSVFLGALCGFALGVYALQKYREVVFRKSLRHFYRPFAIEWKRYEF